MCLHGFRPQHPAVLGMPPDFPTELRMSVVIKPKGEMTQLTMI